MLDLYGTNHDTRIWHDPALFRPDRFSSREPGPFDLIPQGGGDHAVTHRCPGEDITLSLMKVAASALARRMTYDVPGQDLSVDFTRLPALPRSRFVMRKVRG